MYNFTNILRERRNPMEVEVYDFLASEGIQLFPYWHIQRTDDLATVLAEIPENTKYVMKVMSPRILHKSDFKAIRLNVRKNEIEDIYHSLLNDFAELDFRGVLITKMAEDGIELILGSTTDATFGLISVFGIGGTMVEIVKDVTFAKGPLSLTDAFEMIKEIRTQKYLDGPRGLPPLNREQMAKLLVQLSAIAEKYKKTIREIDLNPIRVLEYGIFPLDARLIFHPEVC